MRIRIAALSALVGLGLTAGAARAEDEAPDAAVEQLRNLSIDQLANVQVTTVSRREEPLAQAPTAAYVITHEEIMRSGARTLPEILRLAPNLFVAQTGASSYVITARGLSGNNADQNFSNKLLVLIDGRSVYSPLYSGVAWDMQDVLPDDIDHIEVISGPAGTLWGANAVEGVINIITRHSAETQGAYAEAGGGNLERSLGLRYGGRVGDDVTWRLSARGYYGDDLQTSAGADAGDHWSRGEAAFRLDWTPTDRDAVLFEGQAFDGSGEQFDNIGGGYVLSRWTHVAANGSSLQVQAYVDHEQTGHDVTGGTPQRLNTYDLDVQDGFSLGRRNDLVVGGDFRLVDYRIEGTSTLSFAPNSRTLNLSSLFVQDTVSLTPELRLILGLKLEDDPFSRWSTLPNVRLAWNPTSTTMLWAAASQAIRSPTPFDVDVRESTAPGQPPLIYGDPEFQPEKLTAYEAGVRLQPVARASFSVSAYYDVYDDLRTLGYTPVTLAPLVWGNDIKGHTAGVEAWGNLQVAPWWRLSASVNLLTESFREKPGSTDLLGVDQQGDDPRRQAALKSSVDLGPRVTWDAELRYQSALPAPYVPSYVELNTRIAWNVTDRLQLAVSGFNLLHERHVEFAGGEAVPRSAFVELRWGF